MFKTSRDARKFLARSAMQASCWAGGICTAVLVQRYPQETLYVLQGMFGGVLFVLSLAGALWIAYHAVRFLCREYHLTAILLASASTWCVAYLTGSTIWTVLHCVMSFVSAAFVCAEMTRPNAKVRL